MQVERRFPFCHLFSALGLLRSNLESVDLIGILQVRYGRTSCQTQCHLVMCLYSALLPYPFCLGLPLRLLFQFYIISPNQFFSRQLFLHILHGIYRLPQSLLLIFPLEFFALVKRGSYLMLSIDFVNLHRLIYLFFSRYLAHLLRFYLGYK